MAFDFPNAPTIGQLYPASVAAGLPQYKWNGNAWIATGSVENYVKKSGDTMTGALVLNADPAAPLGAATKQYVDSKPAPPDISGKVNRAGDTMTGLLTSAGSGTQIGQATNATSINVMNSPGSGHAFMTFSASGYFAGNFGIANDGNFYMGGLNFGATTYKFWTTRDFTALPNVSPFVSNARMVVLGNYLFTANAAIVEPYNGGFATANYCASDATYVTEIGMSFRALQLFTGSSSWWTVPYA
jgi:hypothetical protein